MKKKNSETESPYYIELCHILSMRAEVTHYLIYNSFVVSLSPPLSHTYRIPSLAIDVMISSQNCLPVPLSVQISTSGSVQSSKETQCDKEGYCRRKKTETLSSSLDE